ncbi:MAG TPA: SpoIIE family protein phosphatase, partial [Anaerolineales bacterium]|nr:SpoIIE family protein phosphatase [Anaerolineales bacterium]
MTDRLLDPAELRKIPLFSSVSEEDLRQLTATMNLASFSRGEIIVREGDRGDSFYTIISGQAAIIKSIGTPEEQQLFIAKKGDFIGEMALFEPDGVRVATVIAHTDVVALEMTRAGFDDLIHNQPQLAYEVSRVLSLRVRDVNNWLQSKNEMLEQALEQLRAAQAELIDKERMERELELARKIQEDILPRELPQPNNYNLGARMAPAREVGGDFFDFIRLSEHRIGVLIGDVSDKGVPAAIFMALTRSLIHAEARRSTSPRTVLKRVNNLMHDMSEAAMFVTVLYGIMDCDSGYFEYARAGHELPIILNNDGHEIVPPHDQGQPLALFEDPVFDTQGIHLTPGTTLLLYTDGATDTTGPEDTFFGL